MSNVEQQKQDVRDLLQKIKDHIAGNPAIAHLKFSGLSLTADGEGTHMCCGDGPPIELPDSVPCPFGFQDC